MDDGLSRRAAQLFASDLERPPAIALRGGDVVDSYREAPAYDPEVDRPNDAYLERYAFFGLIYLDPGSWRHYLPVLIDYTLRHLTAPGDLVIEALLFSLRPPGSDPPRFGSLSESQTALVEEFLEFVAFDAASAYQDDARQVLQERTDPGPRAPE